MPLSPAERRIVSAQFPAEIYDRIQAEAAELDRSPSWVLRKAAAEHFERLEGRPIAAGKIRSTARRGEVT